MTVAAESAAYTALPCLRHHRIHTDMSYTSRGPMPAMQRQPHTCSPPLSLSPLTFRHCLAQLPHLHLSFPAPGSEGVQNRPGSDLQESAHLLLAQRAMVHCCEKVHRSRTAHTQSSTLTPAAQHAATSSPRHVARFLEG